jgi:Zn finger protein HypA/HybF involved in hydrogenase expression
MDGVLNELLVRIAVLQRSVEALGRDVAALGVEPATLPAFQTPPGERPSCQCPQCRMTIAVRTKRGILCPGCANTEEPATD